MCVRVFNACVKIAGNTNHTLNERSVSREMPRESRALKRKADHFFLCNFGTNLGAWTNLSVTTCVIYEMVSFVWIFYICMIGAHATAKRDSRSYHPTIETYENDTVLLPCYVENQSAQTIVRWWREGILLADSTKPSSVSSSISERVTLYNNGSLRVHHLQREDSGQYVCQVIRPSSWGHVTQVHDIQVMYPPSVETVPASGELEVNLGEKVDMQCVAKGVPAPVISWRTKDGEIPLLDVRPQLSFHADNRNLSGRYTCVATSKVGDPAVGHIDLRIRYKPEIYVRKPWIHAYPGIRVQLVCTVTAWPEAKVEWYFKNETLKYTSMVVKHNAGNDHILLIRDVKTSDYGSYICRASNSLGISERIIELSAIANRAVFKKESHSISSTSYNFIWEVYSYSPIIDYQFWFRKYRRDEFGEFASKWHKMFIPGGTDAVSPVHICSFNLTGLDAATHYEAIVLSRNRYGWSPPSEILRFHTEGAPVESIENFETDDDPEQKNVAVIAVSMSQHYPMAAEVNGSTYNQAKALLLMLTTLCTVTVTLSRF